jgi:hypothetical protein
MAAYAQRLAWGEGRLSAPLGWAGLNRAPRLREMAAAAPKRRACSGRLQGCSGCPPECCRAARRDTGRMRGPVVPLHAACSGSSSGRMWLAAGCGSQDTRPLASFVPRSSSAGPATRTVRTPRACSQPAARLPQHRPPTLAQFLAALGAPPLANACRTFARRLNGSVLRLETLRQPLGSAPRRSAPVTIQRSLRVEASGTVGAADTAMAAEALDAADWEGLCKHIAAYDAQREVVIKACRDVQVMVFRVKEAQG